GASGPYSTVLAIHGGPASAFSDRFMGNWHDWAQLLAAAGFAVLMPNPRGSTGRGAAFTEANFRDLGGAELEDNLAGLDYLIKRGTVDPDRLAVAGWSHGGYMTAWTVTQTNRFKAAVMGAGLSNLVSDQGTNDIPVFNLDYFYDSYGALYRDPALLWERSPLKHVARVTTPTLILHGEKDERVSVSQGREFYQALRSLGVPCEMVVYPREPHGLREREHQLDLQRRIVAWLKRYTARTQ
ncbi:MAG TPA: prolyl oligopeptidase family serine peptidase, partial [Chloroflexota bacterium]|nr:prolyl oligopeptidase family serine peptidase [Chloroflexota bacterium]